MTGATAAATCQPGPSPSARALRLDSLRAPGPAALRELLERLPAPPWDVELGEADPVLDLVRGEGFEEYARVVVMARPVAGMPRPPAIPDIAIGDYRNDEAPAFQALEARAMAGLAAFTEMGQPTGYEEAEGFDIFLAARHPTQGIVGFAQTMTPEGWINWIGVDPDLQRLGIGHALLAETAGRIAAARGSHLAARVEAGGPAQAFLTALGFKARGERLVQLIRRA
ncbi:MAG: GNAT family N-acetyltransferase [Miltoncostaeaceae bacterium]